MTVPVTLNGEPIELPAGAAVADLVEQRYQGRRGIAVAVSGEVVPRSEWSGHRLNAGDRIEVLSAVQGG